MRLFRSVAIGAVLACLAAGVAIVLIQALWITYGVFVRYALGSPDGTVTEATALLLVPLAFLGLPYALKEDAFPRVTFVTDNLPGPIAVLVGKLNLTIMILVGLFFATVTINATVSSFQSGASSSVLAWPEYLFWAPVAVASIAFVIYGVYQLFAGSSAPESGE
ncbi:MAG: TRAP transporter small permease subunit [Planctomycetota bacterium]